MSIRVNINKRTDYNEGFSQLRDLWLTATGKQSHSYFLSWPWVSHWLKSLPVEVEISLATIEGAECIAASLLGRGREKRHGFVSSDSFYLNYTGRFPFDNLTLEYNQIPGNGLNLKVLKALLLALPSGWDELHLPAMDATRFPADCLAGPLPGYHVIKHQERPSFFVDLSVINKEHDSYLRLLSGNTRSGIRRATKKLNKIGELKLKPARHLNQALTVYDDLVAMHQVTWQARGLRGAFESKWFRNFHRELIGKRFASGEIQLLRISCGSNTLGCLLNFVYQGVVHYYQSGFNYIDFGKYKPGLVCHSLAIPYNASLGHVVYDFLAGDAQYKKSLGTACNRMVWFTIQKPKAVFKLENLAKKTKAWIREQKAKGAWVGIGK